MAKTKKKVIINTAQILETAKLFEILGHDLRLSIILLIQEKQNLNSTEKSKLLKDYYLSE